MKKTKTIVSSCLMLIFFLSVSIFAQDEKPPSRSITSLDFQSKRPLAANAAAGADLERSNVGKKKKNSTVLTNPNRRYKLIRRIIVKKNVKGKTQKTLPDKSAYKAEEMGITFWRLRSPTVKADEAALFTVRIGDKTEKWTAERVASTTKFKKDDRVRFTIEPSRSGYLYIVNREFYTDGTSGEAKIIFPTLRTRGGDNRVKAGNLIEIPSSDDSVSYFTITPNRADYAGEEMIILILPDELPNFEIGLRAQTLAPENLAAWFTKWESLVDIYDAEDGEGIVYTETEAQAVKPNSRALTQDEPLPQTIYKVLLKGNAPLFVAFRLEAKQ